MRFNRYPIRQFKGREWTPRQLASAAKTVRREQEKVALFPELARYKSVDERKAEMESWHESFAFKMRTSNANGWRKARRLINAMPPITRLGMLRWWQESNIPGDPSYLLDAIHEINTRHQSPWSWLRLRHQIKLIGSRRLDRCHLNETFE